MLSRLDPYALAGAKLGERYTLESFAGVGRFSAVYRGVDADTRRPIAVRLLKVRTGLDTSQRSAVRQRLRTLVPALRDLAARCPTLAGALDAGAIVTHEGRWMPAIVQRWLAGDTLEAVLLEERRRPAAERTLAHAIAWMTPVADALSCAHAGGLSHGSLATRNIFVQGTTVQLLDVGIAPALAELQANEGVFGAPEDGPFSFFVSAYAAPEHFASMGAQDGLGAVGAAADVFSLALVMVELMTGRAPLGEGDDAQLEAVARSSGVRPTPRVRGRDLGGAVDAVFERALAVRPTDRHASVESFWSALRAASRLTLHARVSTSPPPPASLGTPTLAEASVKRVATPRSSPPPLPTPVMAKAAPSSAPTRDLSRQPSSLERPDAGADDDLEVGSVIAGKYSIRAPPRAWGDGDGLALQAFGPRGARRRQGDV